MEDIQKENAGASDKPKVLIHRVCVTCNKMFTVDAEHYEEKQCPECHPHTPPPKK